jgi:hypothetical protein
MFMCRAKCSGLGTWRCSCSLPAISGRVDAPAISKPIKQAWS